MKLPKKVTIRGREVQVLTNKNELGGFWSSGKNRIGVGTKNPSMVTEFFLHEVLESVFTENNLRFQVSGHDPSDNGDYIFVMTHAQFETIVPQIAVALKDVLKD